METKKAFFKEVIKNFKTSGTVAPSSKHLVKRLLRDLNFNTAGTIVEFGPGNGIITKEILKQMNADCQLICFEINEQFYSHLQDIDDNRLTLLNTSAENINNELEKMNINTVDYIVSSIPFSLIPDEIVTTIIKNAKKALNYHGAFLIFQYSLLDRKKLKQVFGSKNVSTNFELANLPPAFVFKCIKNN